MSQTGARKKIPQVSNNDTASNLERQLEAVRKHVENTAPTSLLAPTSLGSHSPASANVQTPRCPDNVTQTPVPESLLENLLTLQKKMFRVIEKQANDQEILVQQIIILKNKVESLTGNVSEIPNIKSDLVEIHSTFAEVDAEQAQMQTQLNEISGACVRNEDLQENIEQCIDRKLPALAEAAGPQLQPAPISLQTPDQTAISRFVSRAQDLYYLRTVEIRGFHSQIFEQMKQDVTRHPRYWASRALSTDQVEHLVFTARRIKFFWPTPLRAGSLRLTFDSISEARRALTRLAGTRNSLREQGSDFRLDYYQLTPVRFQRDRTDLYNLLKHARAENRVKNFSFVVVGDRLCSVVRVRSDAQGPYQTRLVTLTDGRRAFDDFIKIQNLSSSSELPDRNGTVWE